VPSQRETERQFRVLQQTLSAHTALRDEYATKAKIAEVVLLVCSVIFCATTFAAEGFYMGLGVSPGTGRFVLGVASVLAFASSLAILVVNWKGSATRHSDAAERWASALEEFRRLREEDGSWPEDTQATLSAIYWEAARNSTAIPERSFNRLKARHLRKVEVSKLISKYPGCPRPILALMVYLHDTWGALRQHNRQTRGGDRGDQ
jgi:hypothetical protein